MRNPDALAGKALKIAPFSKEPGIVQRVQGRYDSVFLITYTAYSLDVREGRREPNTCAGLSWLALPQAGRSGGHGF